MKRRNRGSWNYKLFKDYQILYPFRAPIFMLVVCISATSTLHAFPPQAIEIYLPAPMRQIVAARVDVFFSKALTFCSAVIVPRSLRALGSFLSSHFRQTARRRLFSITTSATERKKNGRLQYRTRIRFFARSIFNALKVNWGSHDCFFILF